MQISLTQIASIGRGRVNAITWLPDIQTVAVASTLSLWHYTPDGDEKWIRSFDFPLDRMIFSADGTTLFVWDLSKRNPHLHLYDSHTGKHFSTITARTGPTDPRLYALNDDRTRFAVIYYRQLRVFDTASGELLYKVSDDAQYLTWSPDGNSIVTVSNKVRVYDIHTGTRIRESALEEEAWLYRDNSFEGAFLNRAQVGEVIATCYDRALRIETPEKVFTYPDPKIRRLWLISNGRKLIAVENGTDLCIYDTHTGEVETKINDFVPYQVAIRDDHIAVLRGMNEVLFLNTGKRIIHGMPEAISHLYRQTNETILIRRENSLDVLDLQTMKVTASYPFVKGTFTADYRIAASVVRKNDLTTLIVTDLVTGEIRFTKSVDGLIELVLNPLTYRLYNRYVAYCVYDDERKHNNYMLFDLETNEELFLSSVGRNGRLVLSQDGRYYLIEIPDEGISIFERLTGRLITMVFPQVGQSRFAPVTHRDKIGMSPSSEYIFTINNEHLLQLWHPDTGEESWSIHTAAQIDFHPDNTHALLTNTYNISFLNLQTGERHQFIKAAHWTIKEHAMTRDLKWLALGVDQQLEIWNLAERRLQGRVNIAGIEKLVFNADGTLFAFIYQEQVEIWHTASMTRLTTAQFSAPSTLIFVGQHLAVAHKNGAVTIHELRL